MRHRLLTLNVHSRPDADADSRAISALCELFGRLRPTVVALQEVCQSRSAEPLSESPVGYRAAEQGIVLRRDLFVLRLALALERAGMQYEWSYLPIKLGYGKYDEGVALLSSDPILETETLTVSRREDYLNWKTRRLLGARIGGAWFYSVHFGWYEDPEEPFSEQWARALRGFERHPCEPIYLLGDFNSPAEIRGGGYDLVTESGYFDAWSLAGGREGATVLGAVDGWEKNGARGLRIDHIRSSCPFSGGWACRVLDGKQGPVISDHFGVYAEIEGG